MASVIWKPPPGEAGEAREVRVADGRTYTFNPGVPQDIPQADLATVRTFLGSSGQTNTAETVASPTLTSAVQGKDATRYFEVVTVVAAVKAVVTAAAAPGAPGTVSVVAGVNDQFTYTPTGGAAQQFVVAPGSYTTAAAVAAAMAAALNGAVAFSTLYTVDVNSTKVRITAVTGGAARNSDTISVGSQHDVAVGLGFTSTATTITGADAFDGAPGTAATSAVCWEDADEVVTWTADGAETGGYKLLYSPDNIVPYVLVATIAHGATKTFTTTPANLAAGSVYTPTAHAATTSTGTITPNTATTTYSLAAVTEAGDSIPGAQHAQTNGPATFSAKNNIKVSFTPNDDTIAVKVLRGTSSLRLIGTVPAQETVDHSGAGHDTQAALSFTDVGATGTAYTAAVGAAKAYGVGTGPTEI